VTLSWRVSPGTAYVTVAHSTKGKAGGAACRSAAGSCVVKGLRNGTSYRFVVTAWDRAGNGSKGVVVRATPKAQLLKAPLQGARVKGPPLLRWAHVRGASYYNVQLWKGKQKLLSLWPAGPSLRLKARWSYAGKAHRLLPGRYTWYVWPGLGSRRDARYGPLLGSRVFVVPKPPAL
jgi:hypothetical protein